MGSSLGGAFWVRPCVAVFYEESLNSKYETRWHLPIIKYLATLPLYWKFLVDSGRDRLMKKGSEVSSNSFLQWLWDIESGWLDLVSVCCELLSGASAAWTLIMGFSSGCVLGDSVRGLLPNVFSTSQMGKYTSLILTQYSSPDTWGKKCAVYQ